MANIKLDTAEKSQVITPSRERRSIYDAGSKEILWKSLLAGFALGIGNMIATVLFFGIIAGLLLSTLQPILQSFQLPTQQLEQILEQNSQVEKLIPNGNASPSPIISPTPTTTIMGE